MTAKYRAKLACAFSSFRTAAASGLRILHMSGSVID
jgi:hypothetical protein